MNPHANEFVPSWGPKTTTPASPPAKKQEPVKESWEDKMEVTSTSTSQKDEIKEVVKKTEAMSIDSTYKPTEEEKKEIERMAKEEGISVDELLKEPSEPEKEVTVDDQREHLNLVFIGHVDAGKSTISGSILFHTGMVDMRTIQKYEKEAKDNNRESWFLAYIMDTNEEERAKGKTVEVGRADFETKTKRYTILDAPGHKNYVPNMIGGAAQADVGILVISARRGEFETGFQKGGQTKEHAMLVKTLGVKILIVVVNKMDDPTVEWAKDRWDEITGSLTPYFKQIGFNMKDVIYLPISGLKGINLKDHMDKSIAPWYDGPSLLECLDTLKPMERLYSSPLRIPIMDKFKDRGFVVVMGKVESGQISKGEQLCFMPGKLPCEVVSIYINDTTMVKTARAGENIRILLRGVEEENIHKGYVLCDKKETIPCQTKFEGQVVVLDLLAHKSIFSAGYTAVIHIHTTAEECTVTALVSQLDKKTGQVIKHKPQFVKNGAVVNCIIECAQPIPIELFIDNPQLGRFTLRDEGKTVAVGKIIALGPKKKPVAH